MSRYDLCGLRIASSATRMANQYAGTYISLRTCQFFMFSSYLTETQSGHRRLATFMLATLLFAFISQQLLHEQVVDAQAAKGTSTVEGVVRDAGKLPIAGATVCLQAKDEQTLTALTDSAGAYRFSSVRQGTYTLRAGMAGCGETTSSPFDVRENESRTMDLTLAPRQKSEAQHISPDSPSPDPPEFFDEPHFTVAGVTDTTNLGGHGSDTIVRNREALARATASLGKQAPGSSAGDSATDATQNEAAEESLRGIGDYERARARVLASLAAPSASNHDDPESHHLLGELDEKLGDSLEAVREYQRAAELDASERNLFDWGAELLTHRAPEPAIEVFEKGHRMFPRSVRMLEGLGASWYALGSYDQAVKRICEASDLDPNDPNPYLFMGKMQATESAGSAAIAERLERFARLQPENALANYYYAVSLWNRRASPADAGSSRQVKSLLEKAARLDPKLGLAYLQLGILYSEQEDFARAISAYQKANDATPGLEQAHYRLAQAYRRAGELSKAQVEVELYEQISKEKEAEVERQRHEVQQFVYQMQGRTANSPRQ